MATLKIKFCEAQWDSIQTVVERPKVSVVWSSEINSKYKTCHKCSFNLITPKILLVILLNVCHMVLVMLV